MKKGLNTQPRLRETGSIFYLRNIQHAMAQKEKYHDTTTMLHEEIDHGSLDRQTDMSIDVIPSHFLRLSIIRYKDLRTPGGSNSNILAIILRAPLTILAN